MRRERYLGWSLLALAALLAANSLLGPIAAGAIEYSIPGEGVIESQLIGLDTFSLAIVAPLAATAGLLCLRGAGRAAVAALAFGLYAVYMAPQYILGPEHLGIPGNAEAFFPLHLGIFISGVLVVVLAWAAIARIELAAPSHAELLIGGTAIPLLAIFTFARYIPGITDAAGEMPTAADYLEAPTFYWTIALLDLGLGLPAALAVFFGLRRDAPWARRLAFGLAGWLALTGPAVAAMAIAMYVNDVADSSLTLAIAMSALGIAFAALAVGLHRSALWPRASGRAPAPPPGGFR